MMSDDWCEIMSIKKNRMKATELREKKLVGVKSNTQTHTHKIWIIFFYYYKTCTMNAIVFYDGHILCVFGFCNQLSVCTVCEYLIIYLRFNNWIDKNDMNVNVLGVQVMSFSFESQFQESLNVKSLTYLIVYRITAMECLFKKSLIYNFL